MRIAVAGVPGAWSTERMCDALRQEGVDSFVFALGDCLHDLRSGVVSLGGFDLSTLDGIVVKKLDPRPDRSSRLRLHPLRQLEARGVRIYSRPSVIDVVMDRYRMTMELSDAGLPVPETFACNSELPLQGALASLGTAVVKPVYTSKARGMVRLSHTSANRSSVGNGALAEGPVLLQRFVEAPGRDIGACILRGSFVGAFYRVAAEGEWVTSTAARGRYAPCDLPRTGISLAQAAADVFGLDYTVIDLVESDTGYLIYEASAFGGFRGLWEASRYDVARDYARYVKWDLLG